MQHPDGSVRRGCDQAVSQATTGGRTLDSDGMSKIAPVSQRLEATLGPQAALLRCLACGKRVAGVLLDRTSAAGVGGELACTGCGERYAVRRGTSRMLPSYEDPSEAELKQRTAESFAYEWERFGGLREEWEHNFLGYMQPHSLDHFEGKLVLDVGTGSGRHSYQAARAGARVVAVDLGDSIDVARRNLPESVLTVQADAEKLPFEPETFDLVMSIGVLHHLPDTERGLRAIVPYVKPGGELRVYLYWVPERRWHRALLRVVTAVRRVTIRMPHRLLQALCYPLALVLFALFVLPYRVLRRIPGARRLSEALPLKTYSDYPFRVCVNDQFDRFSAPIERRYTRAEVETMLRGAGLDDVRVLPNHGWVAYGTRR